jgi:hypothetical protein
MILNFIKAENPDFSSGLANPPHKIHPRIMQCQITLFSPVRGGGLRFCRRGFNRRLIFAQTLPLRF